MNWSAPSPWPPILLFPSLNVYTPCFLFFVFLFKKLLHLFQTHSLQACFDLLSASGLDFPLMELRGSEGASDPVQDVGWEKNQKKAPSQGALCGKNKVCYHAQGMAVSFLGLTKTYFSYLSLVGVQMLEAVGGACGCVPRKKREGKCRRSDSVLEKVS